MENSGLYELKVTKPETHKSLQAGDRSVLINTFKTTKGGGSRIPAAKFNPIWINR
jgi:hypothetical protein